LVTALINQLASQAGEGEVLLLLDDYHLIESQSVHTSLIFLLEHLPPQLRLVIASRADPLLPLARLRVRGQLAELRDNDLRFTREEAAVLVREAVGSDVRLPDSVMAMLVARTEGWAAGLQLAALSLRGQTDVASFVATFSGSHRHVLDYLTEEVLERQPQPVRTFLLETSVLDRLSGELCDVVTGRTDSQRMLEAIERANLFLVSLDEVRGWWRYHHLFADLLRVRLQQEQPQRIRTLQGAAANWHEAHGLIDDAIRHAVAAGELSRAARLIERNADGFLLRGEGVTVHRWLALLPANVLGTRPRLLLAQAYLALLGGQPDAVEGSLDAAEGAFNNGADEPFEPSVGTGVSLLSNVPADIALNRAYLADLRGDAERALEFVSRARAETSPSEWMLDSLARGYLALAEWLHGRIEDAERALSKCILLWRVAGVRHCAVRGCYHLAQVQRAKGQLGSALATYRQALEVAAGPGRHALSVAGMAYVGMAEIAYQRGELDSAARYLSEGIPLCRQFLEAQPLATGLATLAWIQHVQGNPKGALEAIEEGVRIAPSPGLLNLVPAQQARLALAQGDAATANRWTQERGLSADDDMSYAREPEYLILVRVLLAQDRADQALALLDRLLALAITQGRTGSIIELRALHALTLAATDDEVRALGALTEALTLAFPEGYIRVFADESAPMATLLARLMAAQRRDRMAARGIPLDYLGRLARAFEQAAPIGTSVVEPLSDREFQVLQLLAAGRQNREIADELSVTVDTVKKHITHILEKLGATNRTEATARARQLGLLP
jgi:LuxR family maltose regulon positive regulatory protein